MKTCYQCPDRYVGCHSKCQPYIDYKKIIDDRKSIIQAEKDRYRDCDSFTSTVINRQKRKPKF